MRLDWIIPALGLAAIWVWALWGYMMRSVRTVGLLLATTVVLALTIPLPVPLAVPVRVAALAAAVWILLFSSDRFVALSESARRFDATYSGVMRALGDLGERRRAGKLSPTELSFGLRHLENQLSATVAPSDGWSELRDQCIAYLRSQRQLYERGIHGMHISESDLKQAVEAGKDLMKAHRRLRLRSRTFWGK